MDEEFHRLAEFDVPIALHCLHCDCSLSQRSPVQIQAPYVIVECLRCGCRTPFKLEAAAE